MNPSFEPMERKAQQGKSLVKEAILDLLKSGAGKSLTRSTIERALGIGSEYRGSAEAESYNGGLASMLLSELVKGEKKGKIKRNKTGNAWFYTVSEMAAGG
jgi:hypothetical protein